MGWGATCNGLYANGQWLANEWETSDINTLELLAAKFALFSFYKLIKDHLPHHGVPLVGLYLHTTTSD